MTRDKKFVKNNIKAKIDQTITTVHPSFKTSITNLIYKNHNHLVVLIPPKIILCAAPAASVNYGNVALWSL